MKMFLTSAGITNPSLRASLVELLGKPIHEANALCIPTAMYANASGATHAARFIRGEEPRTPMCELGWKSLGILEISTLSAVPRESWEPLVREADALLVAGGDPLFLAHWMRVSGLAEMLPTLSNTVYFGFSAGSMVMAPRIGSDFVRWQQPSGDDNTLGFVDFAIFPHLHHPDLPENTMADAEAWARSMPLPCYAIDDATGLRVVDGVVDVISEGAWCRFDV